MSARRFSASSGMWRRERNGITTSGTRSVTGGSRRSPWRRSRSSDTPSLSAYARAPASISGDSSTPITGMPAFATGIAIRPVPIASSTTVPPEATACST